MFGCTGRLALFVVLLLLGPAGGHGQTPVSQAPIPDTAAGHALAAWLDAFNSGDRAKIEAYVKAYEPQKSADMMAPLRGRTGGFDLVGIDDSEPLSIEFRVKERASSNIATGSIGMKDGQPPTVDTFMLRVLPPGAVVERVTLDSARRRQVVDGVAANLKEFYVYPETAQKMEDAVRAHLKNGDYDAVTNGNAFAGLLTAQLQDVSHDKHLRVDFSPAKMPAGQNGPTPEQEAEGRKFIERDNCGFRKVEILPGNIGYLKFDVFADPSVCGPTVSAAMGFLAHVDAVIFDLRENGGGDPGMVALIASYLFDKPAHLNDLYNRKDDATTQSWTLPFVPGARLAGKPAFVLTSKATFSGAEEFSYDLKNLKRATIVGETTGGGAHPVGGHPVGDHFMIGVPFARAINPVSKTNWEGTGVQPDVKVDAADALDTAEKLAASQVILPGVSGKIKRELPADHLELLSPR